MIYTTRRIITPILSFFIETLAAFAAVILILNLAAALILAVYLCRPRQKTYLDGYVFTPFETGTDFEPVSFVTDDGVKLAGWWLTGRGNRVIVGLTGRSGIKSDLLGVGSRLCRAGFHVLLFDFRGRGESGPAPTGMGRREANDVRAAVDYAAARIPGARIGLIGFSMGAAAALLAASEDCRIEALVLDSPFEDPAVLIRSRLRGFFPVTAGVFLPLLTRFWAKVLLDTDIGGLEIPARARRITSAKAFVIVSGNDSVIPPAQQGGVYAALAYAKELWVEPDADHCGAYFTDRAVYVRKIITFFSTAL